MSILAGIIAATVLIGAMMALRIIVDRSVLKQRLKAGHGACENTSCSHRCSTGEFAAEEERAANRKESKRSVPHAS